eukprot:gnl/TRDRNA2_/TRDRNA2_184493_c0_seq1.p1 gnl/TRDRNA2_/TRDRNA2_184493_c0~~gnl/TRDRNA2_/TRDRNA2_184493_c0_seq1.p1  ORF type:complete len:242 (-),score=57.34 gnl/TRDRNA2_/TRDRNA2_184493_c0_seq1:156-881(-)
MRTLLLCALAVLAALRADAVTAKVAAADAVTLAAGEPEPTPDESGLFGPAFDIPLVEVNSSNVVANVTMRLAVTGPEQHHGLMFKKTLPNDVGMLFLYTEARKRVLWMKNTYVPLDAAWFTPDLVYREVHALIPEDLTYRWSDREDIQFGLEMPEGWFRRHHLQPDTVRLDREALANALENRGFQAGQFLGSGPEPQKDDAAKATEPKEDTDDSAYAAGQPRAEPLALASFLRGSSPLDTP